MLYLKDVRESCVSQINQTFPVDCDILPDSNDQNVCKQNPYKREYMLSRKKLKQIWWTFKQLLHNIKRTETCMSKTYYCI